MLRLLTGVVVDRMRNAAPTEEHARRERIERAEPTRSATWGHVCTRARSFSFRSGTDSERGRFQISFRPVVRTRSTKYSFDETHSFDETRVRNGAPPPNPLAAAAAESIEKPTLSLPTDSNGSPFFVFIFVRELYARTPESATRPKLLHSSSVSEQE